MIDDLKELEIAIGLFEARLYSGMTIGYQDNRWHLFDKSGEGVCSGRSLLDLIRAQIFWTRALHHSQCPTTPVESRLH